MKFRSPTSEPIHVALLSGHTCLITPEGTEVEQRFLKEAVVRGAIPVGTSVEESEEPGKSRADLILDAIMRMAERGNVADFTADGRPDVRALREAVGFQVDKGERDAMWAIFTKSEDDE